MKYLAIPLFLLCASAPAADSSKNAAIMGQWSGQMEGFTAIRMTVEELDGKIGGSVMFYMLHRDAKGMTATPTFPEPMFSPAFDGKTLTFKISHRYAHPPRTLNDPPVDFRVEVTAPDKATVYGPGTPPVELSRERQ